MSINDPTLISWSFDTPTIWVVSDAEAAAHAKAGSMPAWLETQASFTTLEALGAAWPDLHKRAPLLRLASALAALNGRKVEQGSTLRALSATLAKSPGSSFRAQRFDHRLHAPDLATVGPPALVGDTLISFEFDEPREVWTDTRHVTVKGYRVTYGLAATGWTATTEVLPVTVTDLDQEAGAAASRFGGPVEGFWTVPVGGASLVVAHGCGAGAAPFLWSVGGVETPFLSWAALAAAHPEVASPLALAALGAVLLRDLSEVSLSPIADPQAWQVEWAAKHRDVVGRHYDAGRRWETITRHTLLPSARLLPPAVSADSVLSFLAASVAQQPKFVAISLLGLRVGSVVSVEALTSSSVVSDGSGGLRLAPPPPGTPAGGPRPVGPTGSSGPVGPSEPPLKGG